MYCETGPYCLKHGIHTARVGVCAILRRCFAEVLNDVPCLNEICAPGM